MTILKTMLGVLLLLTTTLMANGAELSYENAFVARTALIHGKVVDVRELASGNFDFTIEVVHVFYGPKDCVGMRFDAWTWKAESAGISAGSDRLFEFRPIPQRDEIVLWWVQPNIEARKLRPLRHLLATELPSRKGHSPRYESILEWATTVERIANLPHDEQFRELCECASSPIRETSYWSITVLTQEWAQAAESVFEKLLMLDRLSSISAAALDTGMSRLRGERWQSSPDRCGLFERSLRNVETDFDARLIQAHWIKLAREQPPAFPPHVVLQMVQRALSDPICTDRIRNRLFSDVLRSAFLRAQDDSAIWDFAIENIEHPINAQVAGNAAFMLMDTQNRSPRRFRTLLKLYREEKHAKVAEQLGNVLAKWHDGDRK